MSLLAPASVRPSIRTAAALLAGMLAAAGAPAALAQQFTLTVAPRTAAEVNPSAGPLELAQFDISYNGPTDGTLTEIKIDPSGTGNDQQDFSNVGIFMDNPSAGLVGEFDDADIVTQVAAQASFGTDDAEVTFPVGEGNLPAQGGIRQDAFATGTTKRFYLLTLFSGRADVGSTFNSAVTGLTVGAATTVGVPSAVIPGAVIIPFDFALADVSQRTDPAIVSPLMDFQVAQAFEVAYEAGPTISLDSVTFTASGSGHDVDGIFVSIFGDRSGNGSYSSVQDGPRLAVGAYSADNGTVTLNLRNSAILDLRPSTDGGSYKLKVNGNDSAAIAWNASLADVTTAVEAITGVGDGKVTVFGTVGDIYVLNFAADISLDTFDTDDDSTTIGGNNSGGVVVERPSIINQRQNPLFFLVYSFRSTVTTGQTFRSQLTAAAISGNDQTLLGGLPIPAGGPAPGFEVRANPLNSALVGPNATVPVASDSTGVDGAGLLLGEFSFQPATDVDWTVRELVINAGAEGDAITLVDSGIASIALHKDGNNNGAYDGLATDPRISNEGTSFDDDFMFKATIENPATNGAIPSGATTNFLVVVKLNGSGLDGDKAGCRIFSGQFTTSLTDPNDRSGVVIGLPTAYSNALVIDSDVTDGPDCACGNGMPVSVIGACLALCFRIARRRR